MVMLETSENTIELIKALVEVQKAMQPASLDAVNTFLQDSKYATLGSVWEACREPLTANGLAVIQAPVTKDGQLYLITRISHVSGQWIQSGMDLYPAKNTSQAIGAAITYGRRYMLGAMIGIVTDQDDDGNADSMPQQQQPQGRNAKQPARPAQGKGGGNKGQGGGQGQQGGQPQHWALIPDNQKYVAAALKDKHGATIAQFFAFLGVKTWGEVAKENPKLKANDLMGRFATHLKETSEQGDEPSGKSRSSDQGIGK